MRTFTILTRFWLPVCLVALPPMSAHAGFVQVLSGAIDRVVATDNHVAVVRGGSVFILREDGTLLARQDGGADSRATGDSPSDKSTANRDAEHLLDLLDVPEIDRGTDFTDDLVDSELRLAQRRRARPGKDQLPAPSSPPPALAASDGQIWIADARGLFHVGADGVPVPVTGHEGWGAPLSAAGHGLVATRGNALALFTVDVSMAVVPTASLHRVVQLASPARRVALSANAQRLAWTTPAGLAWTMGPGQPRELTVAGAIVDMSFCGDALTVLLRDSILVVSPDGQAEVRGQGIQASRILCGESRSAPWLAVGPQVMASADHGLHWESLALPPEVVPTDAAVSAQHLWLATRDGLFSSAEAPVPSVGSVGRRGHGGRGHGRGTASWLSWVPMPKVSVRAAATFTPGGNQVEALAFAAFPLDGAALPVIATALPEEVPTESEGNLSQPRRLAPAVATHDPDERCLPRARRKAVELAMSEPERARSYVTRAGHTAWLPELRVLVSRRYGRSESLDINSSSTALTSPLGIDTVNDIRYEARATWDLGKLVFSSEELAAQNQAMRMSELRRDIETTMNRLYFERRGLILDRSAGRVDSVQRQVRTSEIEAELDAMSAGAFAVCVSRENTGVE